MREQYTFTFEHDAERKFKSILERLDNDEYSIVEDVKLVDLENPRSSDKQMVIEMDPEAALTFRLGMKWLKIRRTRTEEELKAEAEKKAKNTVKVTVYTGAAPGGAAP